MRIDLASQEIEELLTAAQERSRHGATASGTHHGTASGGARRSAVAY
jgi:hypothetical protein